MVAQIKCTTCTGIFGPSIFENKDARVCRFCQSHERLMKERDQLHEAIKETNGKLESLTNEYGQLKEELRAANGKIDSLTKKSETLQEFVTLNIVGSTSDSNERTPTTAPGSTEHEFQVVRNNVRPKARQILPTVCQNRFQILTDQTDEEEEEVRLVGDSIIGGQLDEFCARAPEKRKRFCIPGGGVDDVIASLDEVSNLAPANTTYVVHVGTNDIQRVRSEELMSKFRSLIEKLKEKSRKVIISGILPRLRAGQRFFNFATSTNRRLANLCSEEGIGFTDTWDSFYHDPTLFEEDGLHLSEVGSARFGRLMNEAVAEYRLKNGGARAQGGT